MYYFCSFETSWTNFVVGISCDPPFFETEVSKFNQLNCMVNPLGGKTHGGLRQDECKRS